MNTHERIVEAGTRGALQQIWKHGRPLAHTDRAASACAAGLARRGLVKRVGLQWSRLDGTKQVAAYELTEAGYVAAGLSR